MASLRAMFVVLAILGMAIPSSFATNYIVGDESGWTFGFDYQAWAKNITFWVGDSITFKYPVAVHNVLKVDKDNFQACLVPINAQVLGTGNDMIMLKTPGTKWYICGVGKHCESGNMKLVINVWPKSESLAPAPANYVWPKSESYAPAPANNVWLKSEYAPAPANNVWPKSESPAPAPAYVNYVWSKSESYAHTPANDVWPKSESPSPAPAPATDDWWYY